MGDKTTCIAGIAIDDEALCRRPNRRSSSCPHGNPVLR
jgi:hypothetical protein